MATGCTYASDASSSHDGDEQRHSPVPLMPPVHVVSKGQLHRRHDEPKRLGSHSLQPASTLTKPTSHEQLPSFRMPSAHLASPTHVHASHKGPKKLALHAQPPPVMPVSHEEPPTHAHGAQGRDSGS